MLNKLELGESIKLHKSKNHHLQATEIIQQKKHK